MMKTYNIITKVLLSGALIAAVSCTDLEEQVLDGVVLDNSQEGSVDVDALLESAYLGTRGFQSQDLSHCLDEHSTDALVGPTRGGDWDDNAIWRQLHTHTWAPDHNFVTNTWNDLLTQVYNCNLIIENGSGDAVAQARFLRAFYYFHIIDKYGQTPYRPEGSSLEDAPLVWSRSEATTFVISELEDIVSSLPTATTVDRASQNAAHFLLAKLYLNKAVFMSEDPAGPYTFDSSDMNQVISHVDALTNTLAADYWDNFIPENAETSPEIIFSSRNVQGNAGNIQSRWRMGQHYNQTPSGWNGFATVAEYYNQFDPNDERINKTIDEVTENSGYNVGYQVGQQYGPGGTTPLEDRNGNPLVFTPELTLITSGVTLETAGIRGVKYVPDYGNVDAPDNDYVLFRYADALLMKAEAILRGGSGDAASIMSMIADRVDQSASAASLDGVYLERAKELWWEGWRRNDMVRFGTFLNSRELKPYESDAKYLLYPIPADALFNPNLTQNPGY